MRSTSTTSASKIFPVLDEYEIFVFNLVQHAYCSVGYLRILQHSHTILTKCINTYKFRLHTYDCDHTSHSDYMVPTNISYVYKVFVYHFVPTLSSRSRWKEYAFTFFDSHDTAHFFSLFLLFSLTDPVSEKNISFKIRVVGIGGT